MNRVLADGSRWAFELHTVKHGGTREERFAGDADAWGDGAADVVTIFVDRVEDRRGAEIDDDDRLSVFLYGRDGVDNAVRAELFRMRMAVSISDSRLLGGCVNQLRKIRAKLR